jgi:general secretion pathway protein N
MNAANQRQLTPLLAVLVMLLGAVLLMFLAGAGRAVRWDAPRAVPPLPSAGSAAGLPQPLPLQQFAVVWQKPLFSPERKPVARAADGGSSLGDLDLTGIILTPGLRMALLRDRVGDREVRLREGESLPDGSVKLVEIHPRSALFDSPAGRTELKLPAGAPIDPPRNAAGRAADPRGQPADGGMMRVDPANPVPAAPQSAADRLRQNIQKRRAARAAAANEGVR